eukprot:403331868
MLVDLSRQGRVQVIQQAEEFKQGLQNYRTQHRQITQQNREAQQQEEIQQEEELKNDGINKEQIKFQPSINNNRQTTDIPDYDIYHEHIDENNEILEEGQQNQQENQPLSDQERIRLAAENRQRRGIPEGASEMTVEEKRQEIWRLFFCIIFDIIGIVVSFNIELVNKEECNMPIKFWFIIYGSLSAISVLFYVCLIRELSKSYITKGSQTFSFIIDLSLLVCMIIGHILLYHPKSTCKGQQQQRLLSDVVLISYLRLIQMIFLCLIIIICCPILLLCGGFRRNAPVAADGQIIKNLNKLSFDEFKAFKKFLRAQKQKSLNQASPGNIISQILSNSSTTSIDQQPLLEKNQDQQESQRVVQPDNPYLNKTTTDNDESDLTCAICLDEFDTDMQVVPLPCKNHSFHINCIEMWLKKNSICPVCRFQVTKDNLKELKKDIATAQKAIKEQQQQMQQ